MKWILCLSCLVHNYCLVLLHIGIGFCFVERDADMGLDIGTEVFMYTPCFWSSSIVVMACLVALQAHVPPCVGAFHCVVG